MKNRPKTLLQCIKYLEQLARETIYNNSCSSESLLAGNILVDECITKIKDNIQRRKQR